MQGSHQFEQGRPVLQILSSTDTFFPKHPNDLDVMCRRVLSDCGELASEAVTLDLAFAADSKVSESLGHDESVYQAWRIVNNYSEELLLLLKKRDLHEPR